MLSQLHVFSFSWPLDLAIIAVYIDGYVVAAINVSLIAWIKAGVQEHIKVSDLKEVH